VPMVPKFVIRLMFEWGGGGPLVWQRSRSSGFRRWPDRRLATALRFRSPAPRGDDGLA
jgi:hypothetical protein